MKNLIITIGLPGSGKSSYLRNYLAGRLHTIISPDLIRGELTGDITDQSRNNDVWKLAYERLDKALNSTEYDYIGFDATLIDKKNRKIFLDNVRKFNPNVKITVLSLEIDFDLASERQQKRVRKVPIEVLTKFSQSYQKPESSEFNDFEHEIISIDKNTPFLQNNRLGFIGDIQSCYEELEKMLYLLGFWKEGKVWYSSGAFLPVLLGDLVDRGNDTVSVLDTVIQLYNKGLIKCIQGNHDSKLGRTLAGHRTIINHGLDFTLEHLKVVSNEKKEEYKNFLLNLPKYEHFAVGQRKFVAAHAFWAPWIETAGKRSQDLMLYGLSDGYLDNGLPNRIKWWDLDKYKSDTIVVIGHYAEKIDLPHVKCADWGACYGNQLACYIPSYDETKDQWLTVQSNWDWEKFRMDQKIAVAGNALSYDDIFNKINTDPVGLINEIENNENLKKTRYNIDFDGSVQEIVVVNASKTLFDPKPDSYSEQACKGLVYNKTLNSIISVSLFKCYNFSENSAADKRVYSLLNDSNLSIECTDKLDGTQIYRFVHQGKVFWGTRSLLISELNELAGDNNTDFYQLIQDVKEFNDLNNPEFEPNKTLIYELLHSGNRTIVPYNGEPVLRCLGYTDRSNLDWVGQYSPNLCPKEWHPTETYLNCQDLNDASNLLQKMNNDNQFIEGFVANIIDQNKKVIFRVKFKTTQFFEAMRLMTYCTYDRTVELCQVNNLQSEEDFIEFIKRDKESFPEELLSEYKKYFQQYMLYIQVRNQYDVLINGFFDEKIKGQNFESRKDMALEIKKYPFWYHLFPQIDGKDLGLDKFFKFDSDTVKEKIAEFGKLLCLKSYLKNLGINRYNLHISKILNPTYNECLRAVEEDGLNLKYVPEEFQTAELISKALKSGNCMTLQYVKNQTEEICLSAVKNNSSSIYYVEKLTEEICLEYLSRGCRFDLISRKFEQTDKIIRLALYNSPSALNYIENLTPEIYKIAVEGPHFGGRAAASINFCNEALALIDETIFPIKEWPLEWFLKISNTEIRRKFIREHGRKIFQYLNCNVLQENDEYVLIQFSSNSKDEYLHQMHERALIYQCPSSGDTYFTMVGKNINRLEDALNFLNNDIKKEELAYES